MDQYWWPMAHICNEYYYDNFVLFSCYGDMSLGAIKIPGTYCFLRKIPVNKGVGKKYCGIILAFINILIYLMKYLLDNSHFIVIHK